MMHICRFFAYVCHLPSIYVMEVAFGHLSLHEWVAFGRPPVWWIPLYVLGRWQT